LLQPYKFVERVVRTGRILNTLEWDRTTSNGVIAKTDLINPGSLTTYLAAMAEVAIFYLLHRFNIQRNHTHHMAQRIPK
jgi:hypothetical protein